MTLKFNAKITVDAKEKTKSIFESINTDNKFYPENPTKTKISLQDFICKWILVYCFLGLTPYLAPKPLRDFFLAILLTGSFCFFKNFSYLCTNRYGGFSTFY